MAKQGANPLCPWLWQWLCRLCHGEYSPLQHCWSTTNGLAHRLGLVWCLRGWHKFCKLLLCGLQVYCGSGGIVGTRYLVEPNYHIVERIFWALMLLASFFGGLNVIQVYLLNYGANVFRLVIEDHPVNNHIQLPSVGLCEQFGLGNSDYPKLRRAIKRIHEDHPLLKEWNLSGDVFTNIMYQSNHVVGYYNAAYASGQSSAPEAVEIFNNLNFTALAHEVHSTCGELFHECSWNEMPFDCCEYFRPVNTLIGKCFILNSAQTDRGKYLNASLTRFMDERTKLKLIFTRSAKVFLLNKEDIPQTVTPLPIFSVDADSTAAHMTFDLVPMVNDREIHQVHPKLKRCRQLKRMRNNNFKYFTYQAMSYSTCLTECLRDLQLRKCGCINYYLNVARNAPFCDLKGYLCLEQIQMVNIKKIRRTAHGSCGSCMPSCTENSITVKNFDSMECQPDVLGPNRSITISLSTFPSKQMRRQILRSYVDVAVSLSGIMSLFMGCNLVNIIELVFIVVRVVITRWNFLKI